MTSEIEYPTGVASRGSPGDCATDGGAGLRGPGCPGRLYQGVPKKVPGGFRVLLEGRVSNTIIGVMQTLCTKPKDSVTCSDTFEMTTARMPARVASRGPQVLCHRGGAGTRLRTSVPEMIPGDFEIFRYPLGAHFSQLTLYIIYPNCC